MPEDIFNDDGYNIYLKTVFNKIYDIVTKNNIQKPLIMFSGGHTDTIKPYNRIESEEMLKFFNKIITKNPLLKKITKNWSFSTEKQSLSTLENCINTKKIIDKIKIQSANVFIFCEQTREKRIKGISKIIFQKAHKIKIVPIDFDVSDNRYLDPKIIKERENSSIKYSLLALKSRRSMKEHHESFKDKIKYLREFDSDSQIKALKNFWTKNTK